MRSGGQPRCPNHAVSSSWAGSSISVHQMQLHEGGSVPERLQLIDTLGETMALVGIDVVADIGPTLTQLLDNLIALPLDDPRIVGTLDHEERCADLIDVGDRGATEEEVSLGLRIADPCRHHPLPRRGNGFASGDQVRWAEGVDGGRPVLRQPANTRQRGKPPKRAAEDPE